MLKPVRSFLADKLAVEVYQDRAAMGQAAAARVAARMRELLGDRESINVVFAAAPSQKGVLQDAYHIQLAPYPASHRL